MKASDPAACTLAELRKNAPAYGCGPFLAAADDLHRTDLYTALLFERLERKYRYVREIFDDAQSNWNQTFYVLLFRTLGGRTNRDAFMDLARRATYRILLRERSSLPSVEALLFGTSGLLDNYPRDSYIDDLREQFVHLRAKYSITPLESRAWRLGGVKPNNHPLLRIAQAAAFLSRNDFVIEKVLRCGTEREIYDLFGVEASQYWSTHYTPGDPTSDRPKRIGRFTANIIGINTVAVFQYAYGSAFADERLRQNVLALLERLPAEDNYCIRRWASYGIAPRNAFETQALLQLGTEHCAFARCAACPLARRLRE